MISGKTYYQILGVLEDAEDIVIRAAYRVLAQKYHPDKWTGGFDEATKRMSEINAAYETLSDVKLRQSYDATIGKNQYRDEAVEPEETDVIVDKNWSDALDYFPDLEGIANSLRRVSRSLEHTYKLLILEKKLFNEREKVAEVLQQNFFESYFGTNPIILECANVFIKIGNRQAAKDLNRAVNLLGSNIDAAVIIDRLIDKHVSITNVSQVKLAFSILRNKGAETPTESECVTFVSALGGYVGKYWLIFSFVFDIEIDGERHIGVDLSRFRTLARDQATALLSSRFSK